MIVIPENAEHRLAPESDPVAPGRGPATMTVTASVIARPDEDGMAFRLPGPVGARNGIPVLVSDDDLDDDEDGLEEGVGDGGVDGGAAPPGFGDELDDDDADDFDDIDEDDFDDDFDDDFEEELEDDYEIEIDDEISAEFGLSGGDDDEDVEDDLDDFDDFDEI